MNQAHVDSTLNKIRAIYERASQRIDDIKPGQKIPATVMAEELAK